MKKKKNRNKEAPYIEKLTKAKLKLKTDLIKLSFIEKIAKVIEMQKLTASLHPESNRPIWTL